MFRVVFLDPHWLLLTRHVRGPLLLQDCFGLHWKHAFKERMHGCKRVCTHKGCPDSTQPRDVKNPGIYAGFLPDSPRIHTHDLDGISTWFSCWYLNISELRTCLLHHMESTWERSPFSPSPQELIMKSMVPLITIHWIREMRESWHRVRICAERV